MLQLGRPPLRWSTGPPFGCSPHLEISLDQTSIFQLYQTIFNAFRIISPSPGTVTWKPKQSRLRMSTRIDEKNRITRLEIKFIWRQRIYDYGSRRKEGVLSFILGMSGRSKSRKWKGLPRITLSNCRQNI